MKVTIIVKNGTAKFVWHDQLAGLRSLGSTKIRRASHVEPTGDGSGFTADMSPCLGPVLGPFLLRREALTAEVEWLASRLADVVV